MLKILIIDDDTSVRNSLAHHFEDFGHTVVAVDSAENAIESIKKAEFDAIIVDLRLPGMSGDNFIIETYNETNNAVYLIHTASTEFTIEKEFENFHRVSGFLFQKPIADLTLLNKEIETMMAATNPADT